MQKKFLVLITLIILSSYQLKAQNLGLNLAERPQAGTYEYDTLGGTYWLLGYGQFNFLNNTFFKNKADGIIENKGGWDVEMFSVRYKKISFDVGFFWTWFDVKDEEYVAVYQPEYNRMYGWNFYTSFFPLQGRKKITDRIAPYVGVGYQTAALKAMYDVTEKNSQGNNTTKGVANGSLDVGGALWKTGLQFNISPILIKLEYRQSLNMSSPTAINHFSIKGGFGI